MNNSRTNFSGYNSGEGYAMSGKAQRSSTSFFGLIQWFIVQFLQSIPFSIQVFLRRNRGSMTFSWLTIFFAALWVRFILDGTYQLDQLHPPDTFDFEWFNKGNGVRYYFAVAAWYIGVFFIQFKNIVTNFFPSEAIGASLRSLEIMPILPFLISIGVVLLGATRKWNIKRMHDRRVIFDPMSKGESVPFEKLLDRINPKDRNLTLVLLEMSLLFLLAFGMYVLSFGNPEWFDYAGLFTIGAIGIGIEEWRAQQQKRTEIEIRFANEFKARDMQETYSQYQNDISLKPATVSFIALSITGEIVPTSYTHVQTKAIPISYHTFSHKVRQFSLKHLLMILIVIAVCITVFTLTKREEIQEVGIVQTPNLTVRKKPSLSAKSIGTISQGTVLEVYDCFSTRNDNRYWCKIKYNDQVGYVSKIGSSENYYMWSMGIWLYEFSFKNLPYEDKVITKEGGHLNLRSSPTLNATVIQEIANGETVIVIDMVEAPKFLTIDNELIFGSWCLVEYQGQQGYCFSWYLNEVRIPNIRPAFDRPLK